MKQFLRPIATVDGDVIGTSIFLKKNRKLHIFCGPVPVNVTNVKYACLGAYESKN